MRGATILNMYRAIVKDQYGYEVWNEIVEAQDHEDARHVASAEYREYIQSAYEPGDYKAQVILAEPFYVKVDAVKPCDACETTMMDPCHECGGTEYEPASNT